MELSFKGTLEEFRAVFNQATFQPSNLDDLVDADEVRLNTPPPLVAIEGERTDNEAPVLSYEEIVSQSSVVGPDMRQGLPEPLEAAPVETSLPKLTDKQRTEGWALFKEFCLAWDEGFEDPDAEQPDRLQLMKDFSQSLGALPFLVMVYEIQSLQRLVEKALVEGGLDVKDFDDEEAYLDYIDRVAGTMVQVSQAAFPDVQGTYDYSTRWRRRS